MAFKVTYPYGATDPPYSSARPHRGDDYALPEGTPLLIGSTRIGLVGQTGLAYGPHVHAQAGRDEWAQQTIDPRPYTWKGGTVVKTGEASEWGKYVCVRVDDINVFYCHLSRIDVVVGQVIEGGTMEPEKINLDTARILAHMSLARDGYDGRPSAHAGQADEDLNKHHVGQPLTNDYVRKHFFSSKEASQAFDIKAAVYKERDALRKQVAELKAKVAAAGAGTADPQVIKDAESFRKIKELLS